MLVFQRKLEHILERLDERVRISEKEFMEIVEEINAHLPDDWRLTRTENNFVILVKYGTNFFKIVGNSCRAEDGRIFQRINSVFHPHYSDTIDVKNLAPNQKDRELKDIAREKPEINIPNLYFFHPRPDNASSPLFARQYKKVKLLKGKKGEYAGDQYHRIHPLTKDGLDLEHFLWVRWFVNGDMGFVQTVPEDYHGEDYWLVDPMHPRELERALRRYERVLKENQLSPRQPLESRPSHYEIEYKFLAHDINEMNSIKSLFPEVLKQHLLEVEHRPKRANTQTDIYFDDGRFTLLANGVSFRIRESKGNLKATMKKRLPVQEKYSATGLYERIEEEAVITALQKESLLKGERIKALPYRLLEYVAPAHGSIMEKLQVQNNRERWIVRNSSGQKAEVFFDRVTYLVNNKELGSFNEVEIESKGIPREELEKIACYLEENLGMIPSRQSKYERGVSLIRTAMAPAVIKPVIIDTDCGVDDALALVLALRSPELEVMAVTAVSGNVHVDKVVPNVFKVFNALGLEKMHVVAKGAEKPLGKEFEPVPSVHGEDGLGDADSTPMPENIKLDERPAWKVIVDMAREHPKQITLITVGPMTNLALAIQNDPEGVKNLKEVVAMGGVFFDAGNIRADAEFNVYSDPGAAEQVVKFCKDSLLLNDDKNKHVPLTFVGLDVTHKVLLRRGALERAASANSGNKLIQFIRDISRKYMDFYKGNEGLPGCYLHDPLAVAYVINPAFLNVEKHIINVETRGQFTNGMIFPDDRPTRNPEWRDPKEAVIGVARDVEREAFEEFFFSRLVS
ncbi:MAG: nucleoside hydrolase [Nitrospinae bacterium]|nr:nucleoside hydrolase [Nitrospinota bacterium]